MGVQPRAPLGRGTSVSSSRPPGCALGSVTALPGAFRRPEGTASLPHQVTWWSWGRDPVLGGSCLWGRAGHTLSMGGPRGGPLHHCPPIDLWSVIGEKVVGFHSTEAPLQSRISTSPCSRGRARAIGSPGEGGIVWGWRSLARRSVLSLGLQQPAGRPPAGRGSDAHLLLTGDPGAGPRVCLLGLHLQDSAEQLLRGDRQEADLRVGVQAVQVGALGGQVLVDVFVVAL